MIQNIIRNKPSRLFIVLGGFFIANALIAEFIGVKIFSLEDTLGVPRAPHCRSFALARSFYYDGYHQ